MNERMDAVFSALSDPTRRQVIERVAQATGASATEIAQELPISRQAVAKHLAALSEAGLVESERDGRAVRYRLTPAPMNEALSWIARVGAEWDERLRALGRHLQG